MPCMRFIRGEGAWRGARSLGTTPAERTHDAAEASGRLSCRKLLRRLLGRLQRMIGIRPQSRCAAPRLEAEQHYRRHARRDVSSRLGPGQGNGGYRRLSRHDGRAPAGAIGRERSGRNASGRAARRRRRFMSPEQARPAPGSGSVRPAMSTAWAPPSIASSPAGSAHSAAYAPPCRRRAPSRSGWGVSPSARGRQLYSQAARGGLPEGDGTRTTRPLRLATRTCRRHRTVDGRRSGDGAA